MMAILQPFASVFSKRVWQRVMVLVVGAILVPGQRTVASALRVMIVQLRRWLPERAIVVVADSSYAVLELLDRCRRLCRPVTMITRLRLDAALYHPAPPRRRLGPGRPRLKGERQPTLQTRLSDPQTDWQRLSVRWYGGAEREVELATGSAVWRHSRLPPAPIRWVLVRDPEGRFEPRALLSTDLEADATRIVQWFVLRWQLEVTFHEVRTRLGVECQHRFIFGSPAVLGKMLLSRLL